MLSVCMLMLTIMTSGIDVQAVDFNQESVQVTDDDSLEKTEMRRQKKQKTLLMNLQTQENPTQKNLKYEKMKR